MGLLALERLLSMQRQQQKGLRGHIQAPPNGSFASRAKRKWSSHHSSQGCKRMSYSGLDFPEDIWCHILSLLPMRDAARFACVSQAFLRFWRGHPNLHFNTETLGLDKIASQKDGGSTDLTAIVDHIMEKHLGFHVKTFKLAFCDRVVDTCHLNDWLQTAGALQVEDLSLSLPSNYKQGGRPYNFPSSTLVDERGNTRIQKLFLGFCAFRPVSRLANLTMLDLCMVHITGDELGSLLSNSSALERLTLSGSQIQLSFGEAAQVKNVTMRCFVQWNTVYNACVKLPSIVPNVETLNIYSASEMNNIPILPIQFLHLKHLSICLGADWAFCQAYDYLSLVHFLDACPVLETFELIVSHTHMMPSDFIDPSNLRQRPEYLHNNIKKVRIIGFCSAKSLVELACHIIKNATSLECLTWDIRNDDYIDRHTHKIHEWIPPHRLRMIRKEHKALLAVQKYIMGKIPSAIKLNVIELCKQCHGFVT